MSQLRLLSIAQYRKTLRCERFLYQMDQVVPWKKLCDIIKLYHQQPETGRKPIAIERKLRIICLQHRTTCQTLVLRTPSTTEILSRNFCPSIF